METNVLLLTLTAATIAFAGCADKPTSGVVGWRKEFAVGSFAPDIPFTSADGKQTMFHNIRQPIAIVAFVSPTDGECCMLKPELVSLSKRFKVLPITVAQVSLPTEKCPHGPGCVDVGNHGKTDVVALCDPDRIAWGAYGRPDPSTVILIDDKNRVAKIVSTANLKALADKAEQMADAVNDRRFGIDIGP